MIFYFSAFFFNDLSQFSYARRAKQENCAFLRVDEVALAIKDSFRYTSEWLPTAHRIERSFFMSNAALIHEQHANLKYKYGNKSFWSKGYYVTIAGLTESKDS